MKNLKYIVLCYSFIFGLTVQAQEPPPADDEVSRADEVFQLGQERAEASGEAAAAQQFQVTIREVFGEGGSPNQQLQVLQQSANGVSSSAGLASFMSQVSTQAQQCSRYVARASTCCRDAAACGGGGVNFRELASSAASIAPMLAGIFGGENGGGMASCLSALPGLIDGMGVSNGESAVCRKYRNGENNIKGCNEFCGELINAIDFVSGSRISAIETAESVSLASQRSQLNELKSQIGESRQTCVSNTSEGEAEAEEASNQMQQTAQSAVSCADAFAEEDEDLTEDNLNTPTPIDPADVAGISSGNGNPLSKAGYESFGSGTVGGEEFDDVPDSAPNGDGNRNGNQNAGLPGGMGGFPGGMGGAGAGQGAAAQKTDDKNGRGMASKKASNLISGYGKPSGSSASGPRSGKRGKFRFADLKKKKEDEKKGAFALAKMLAAAGVSPNSQDDIFERNTKRFVAASVKEKLFDAKKNKKLWMK